MVTEFGRRLGSSAVHEACSLDQLARANLVNNVLSTLSDTGFAGTGSADHVIADFAEFVQLVGRMAVFRPPASVDRNELDRAIAAYETVLD